MSSRKAIPTKPLLQSNVLLRILVRILFKDFGSRVIEYISCARAILKKDFPKDLPVVCFVVTQHSESALSLCLRYSKTSCL